MPDRNKKASGILDKLASNEESVSKLYRGYADAFPVLREFWSSLASEEVDHASCIRSLGSQIGILPVFLSLTEGMDRSDRRKTIYTSVLTATILALSFMFLGKWLLLFMGITIADFRVAGGILLLIL